MRSLFVSSLVIVSAFMSVAPASAATRMHSARVMIGQVHGTQGTYYRVQMNGKMYALMPMDDYNHLLENCKAKQAC